MSEARSNTGDKPLWNSLEVVKLIVAALIPVSVGLLSCSENRRAEAGRELQTKLAAEAQQAAQERAGQTARFERVAEERTRLWQEMGPALNDIYAYLLYVGHWKEMTAVDAVAAKRKADKLFYANRPFFSDRFAADYDAFMKASFQMWNGMGEDAKPKTEAMYRKSDDKMLVSGQENSDAVHKTYYALLNTVADEFGLKVTQPVRPLTPTEKAQAKP